MQKHHRVIRIVVGGIIIIVIALAVGFLVNSKTASAPSPVSENKNLENTNQGMDQTSVSSVDLQTQASSSLNKITPTSKVNADIDAYLNSSNSVSNPNDFNDSYSDLNQ